MRSSLATYVLGVVQSKKAPFSHACVFSPVIHALCFPSFMLVISCHVTPENRSVTSTLRRRDWVVR